MTLNKHFGKLLALLILVPTIVMAESGIWVRPSPGQTPSVQLGWDYTNAEPNLAGFYVYQGGSSWNYTNRVLFAGALTRSGTITNVIPGRTYYFAATAITTDNLESDFSNELAYRKPGPPNLNPNQMRGLFVRVAANGDPNTLYAIERSTDLKHWEQWDFSVADSTGEFGLFELPLETAFYRTKEYP